MTAPPRRALAVLLAALAVAGLFVLARQGRPARKPDLLLLTSLPLQFGEAFGVGDLGSPALTALSKSFTIKPISTTTTRELARGRLLLMAQPPAQAPENLVALDDWVRRGGRVLLLADPLLEWPSGRALGDPLRPPVMFTDTGLLGHWGLRLDAPDRRGAVQRELAGETVTAISPGTLDGVCPISPDRFVADCRIGQGRAIVVADADLLNPAQAGSAAGLGATIEALTELSRS